MSRLRRAVSALARAARWPFRWLREWWAGFDSPQGQVAVVGLLGMGIGVGVLFGLGWGLLVPSAILTAIGMGFDLRRSR